MSADRFELELTTMAHGGSALGRHEGQTVFVPYTLPGERALVRVTEGRGKIAFARVERLLAASADRVLPQCPHFARACCSSWQHIDYAAQLLLKQDILNDQLQRIAGLTDAEIESAVQPLIASPIQWGYNHHMTLHVSDSGEIGLPDADNRIIPLDECSLLHPDLLALYETLDLDFPNLRRLKLQIGTDGAHMLMLSVAGDEPPELETDLPTSVNMLLEDNEPVNLIGASHSRYEVRGHSFRVTAGGFFRANIAQLDNLVGAVLNALTLTGDQRVLDGYAGVGLFSAFIAPRARLVTLVESYPPAATDADENLIDFDNVDVIEGSVEDALTDPDEGYDAAVLDPGGSGLSVDVIDALGELQIPRLVYVSSDPATLARDLKRLAPHGYRLTHAQPIDLAPQTYYIDTVARIERE